MWLSTKAPTIAYAGMMSGLVHQTLALLAQCAAPSPIHDNVQYTVIIGGLLYAITCFIQEYSRFASDDWAEHKASKYLETRYWTPTFETCRIRFFMLLCALRSSLITLWIIICTFCSTLPWQKCTEIFYIFYPSGKSVPSIKLLNSPEPMFLLQDITIQLSSPSPCIYLHLSELRPYCHQNVCGNDFDETHHANNLLPWHVQ